VSSHILSEVEQTCDQVAIVARGRCVAQGRVDELLRGATDKIRVRVASDDAEAARVLGGAGWTAAFDEHGALIVNVNGRGSDDITRCLAQSGLFVSELTPVTRSLEDVFMELTEEPA
jgi:ABC-2 type transport system ATP-binding protein